MFLRGFDALVQLSSGARAVCTAASPERVCDGAGNCWVTSTTGACATRTSCVPCRGLSPCAVIVPVRDGDVWLQLCCSAGCTIFAQLRHQSATAVALAIARVSTTDAHTTARVVCSAAAAYFRAKLRYLCAIAMHGYTPTIQQGARSVHSCVTRARLRWR